MKKTILSLSFVLISSFAMANTIEVKEETKKMNLLEDLGDCNIWAADLLDFFDRDNELTAIQAHNTYRELVVFCETNLQ